MELEFDCKTIFDKIKERMKKLSYNYSAYIHNTY